MAGRADLPDGAAEAAEVDVREVVHDGIRIASGEVPAHQLGEGIDPHFQAGSGRRRTAEGQDGQRRRRRGEEIGRLREVGDELPPPLRRAADDAGDDGVVDRLAEEAPNAAATSGHQEQERRSQQAQAQA